MAASRAPQYGGITALASFADISTLALGHHDGTVRILDSKTLVEKTIIRDHLVSVTAVEFIRPLSEDYVTSATAEAESIILLGLDNGAIEIRNLNTKQTRTLNQHAKSVTSLAISTTGLVASTSLDMDICIWCVVGC